MALFSVVAKCWELRTKRDAKNTRRTLIAGAVAVGASLLLASPLLLGAARESRTMATEAPGDLAELREGLMGNVEKNHGKLLSVFQGNDAHPLRRRSGGKDGRTGLRSEPNYNQGALSYVAIALAVFPENTDTRVRIQAILNS